MLLTALRNAVRGKTNELLKELLTQKPLTKSASNLKKSSKMSENSTAEQSTKDKLNSKPILRKERQQQANKKKATPYIPGTVTLQILGAGSNGAPAAVYLFTDQSRYLFNCGEGTQRLAHEHKTKLARLEQIFVTRNTWPAIGGFPGLALTVQDAGVKELALHGPPYLENILYSMKRFVVLKNLQLKTVDRTQIQDFEDSVMSVKSVPLYRLTESQQEEQTFLATASTEEQIAITYICKLKPRPGALNLEKCVEHGVPPGPLLGLLKNGIDVTLEDGTVVKSSDVSEPNENPLAFMFLDIPSKDFLGNLEKHREILLNTNINTDNTPQMPLVVHFSPAEVIKDELYQSFVKQFPAKTQHIYLNNEQNTFSGYIAAHRIQYQLNLLNPRVFPLLAEASSWSNNLSAKLKKTKLAEDELNDKDGVKESDDKDKHLMDLNAMSYYHFRPRKGLDRTLEVKLSPQEYIEETHVLEEFPSLLQKLKEDFKHLKEASVTAPQYPVITFLGTGSCIPNKTRNVSSILIQAKEDSFILLDCGEGSLGQIQRFFGCSKAQEIVKNLKCIYVSHLHADHHIGLIGLLTERLKLLGNQEDMEKVLLLAPKQIEPWLNFYHERILNIKNSYELIGNAEIMEEALEFKENQTDFGLVGIKTCLVKHCPHSFGVRVDVLNPQDLKNPIKITYSGDTMPCQDLIDLGLNSQILIHEATMEDDLEEEAKIKTHSTISQAIQQGQLMQAQHTILTHFSQRYAKLPRLQLTSSTDSLNDKETKETNTMQNVSIAFDNMQVSLKDLEHFHLMYPAMRSLFAEHAEELEQKALKRELKLERKRKLLTT
ncbi:ribonuclease Z, mitochondrial [Lucilia sericata]|uniref:ribonuclease Z, mitochondrial n=1 Tax=Lucilia sericata TaxID=13632 RepID=UPI0018A8776E|nr:ribonuclease Z, mitochondrial [Lucilia sericata]